MLYKRVKKKGDIAGMELSPLASKVTCYCTENNRNDLKFIHLF